MPSTSTTISERSTPCRKPSASRVKIILAGGGTGGHLYPGVAIAQEFRRQRPEAQILFAITRREIDQRILSQEGWEYVALPVESFRGVSLRTVRALGCLVWSIRQAARLVQSFQPSLIIGLGAYPSVPMIVAGKWHKVSIVIQEQNLFPGGANKMLARWAERVFISFPATECSFPGFPWGLGRTISREKIILAGNPVRQGNAPRLGGNSDRQPGDMARPALSPQRGRGDWETGRRGDVPMSPSPHVPQSPQGRGEEVMDHVGLSPVMVSGGMDASKDDLRSLFGLESKGSCNTDSSCGAEITCGAEGSYGAQISNLSLESWMSGEEKFTLLIFGGSKGAHRINEAVMEGLADLLPPGRAAKGLAGKLRIIHQTGQEDFEEVKRRYQQIPVKAIVLPFIYRMIETYQLADLVVCRAGATTVAEITLMGKAAIMIPYPYAVGDHQATNAGELKKAGAAELILDRDLSGKSLWAMIQDLAEHPQRLAGMREESKKLGKPDAASRIVQECLNLIENCYYSGR